MRRVSLAMMTAATLSLSGLAANAFPASRVITGAGVPAITLVSGGCGPYAHRGDDDECHPNRRVVIPFGDRFLGNRDGFDGRDRYRRHDEFDHRDGFDYRNDRGDSFRYQDGDGGGFRRPDGGDNQDN
jgi:hypothetical protein